VLLSMSNIKGKLQNENFLLPKIAILAPAASLFTYSCRSSASQFRSRSGMNLKHGKVVVIYAIEYCIVAILPGLLMMIP